MNSSDSTANDAVVDEIRQIRDEYSERFHGDLSTIVTEMRREHSEIVEITRPPRKSTGRPQPKRRTPNPERLIQERTTP